MTNDRPSGAQFIAFVNKQPSTGEDARFAQGESKSLFQFAVSLSDMVAADPQNSTIHCRRVLSFCELGDGDETYGALVDLFISLGAAENATKQAMLQRTRAVLTDAQYASLLQQVNAPAFDESLMVPTAAARLTANLYSDIEFIKRIGA